MGDLRLKAQELLKVSLNSKEPNNTMEHISKEKNMNKRKEESKRIFTEKIQKEINEFQDKLLKSANNGETLKIEILRLDTEGLLSWWDEREDKIINTRYTPIKSSIITFIDDINLKFLTNDIITDKTLQKLYDLIRDNDIYPQWKVTQKDGKMEALYIEADPTVSYRERKDTLHREKNINQRALVVQNYQQNIQIEEIENSKIEKIKNFVIVLYFSVMVLTILSRAINIVSISDNSIPPNFVEIAWPYFLSVNFSGVWELFIYSLPLGILLAIVSVYKKS